MTDTDPTGLRELLFGDLPLARVAVATSGEVGALFTEANLRLLEGDEAAARAALFHVLQCDDLEARTYLQAWGALRSLGVSVPPELATRVYGVVLDVPVDGGLDTLAAYVDESCRYLNHAAGAVILDQPTPEISAAIGRLLDVARVVVDRIGPWDGARPPLPAGRARLSILCPSGLYFGEGQLDQLLDDELGGALFGAGVELLQLVTALPGGS